MERLGWGGIGHLIPRSVRIRTLGRSAGARSSTSESRLEMSEQIASRREEFRTVLREQQQRVVDALATGETIDATPILQEDDALSSEEYVTLVYEFHHVHLPELEAGGVIEFDRREETLRQGTSFDDGPALPAHDDDG